MDARDFSKYLRRSGNTVRSGAGFSRAVVIPAFDEAEELPAVLASIAAAQRLAPVPAAVIVVVNHPAGTPPGASFATLEAVSRHHCGVAGLFVLYAPGLAGGAGAARKIGMDAFVAAHDASSIDGTLIFSLDADTRIAPEYFLRLEEAFAARPEATFCTVGFRHRAGEGRQAERAVREYEAYLREYVEGLRRAGSPYAFMSIGSAFAVRGAAYIRAGGMKVRRAGEDFYFMQEAAKCGILLEVPEVLTFPSARISGRNPFGTGPALSRILAGGALRHIDPEAFDILREVLAQIRDPESAADPVRFLSALPPRAAAFFAAEGFPEIWRRILRNTPPRSREAAFHRWFDGLKTLRLLHRLSD